MKVIKLTESDIENLVKKIITESRLDEIGGYDSPELGNLHSKSTMEAILKIITNVSDDFTKLNNMSYDILDDKLASETHSLIKNIQPLLQKYGQAWTQAEKRRIQK